MCESGALQTGTERGESVFYISWKHIENKGYTKIHSLQTEGYSPLFFYLPPVSVFRSTAEHSENKSGTVYISLTDCRRPSSVCNPRFLSKMLKNIPLSWTADYRLKGAYIRLRLLPPMSVFRSTEELSESKSGTGLSLLHTASENHLSVNLRLALKRWEPCYWVRMRITDWGGQTLFSSISPLCLSSVLPRNTLKTRIILNSPLLQTVGKLVVSVVRRLELMCWKCECGLKS